MQLEVSMIRTLKGAPISILLALAMIKQPVTVEWLQTATGYSDKSVARGLKVLKEFGFAQRNGRYAWQLCGDFKQLPLAVLLDEGEEEEEIPEEIIEEEIEEKNDTENFRIEPAQENQPVENFQISVDNYVDNSVENHVEKGVGPPGYGNSPYPGALVVSRSLNNLKTRNNLNQLTRSDDDPEIFRILDEYGIREPARSQIAGLPFVSVRLVAYHCQTADNPGLAIYRIKKNYRVPKGWRQEEAFEVIEINPDPRPAERQPLPEEIQERWDHALDILAGEIKKADFYTWVLPAVPKVYTGASLLVGIGNHFARNWLIKNVKKRLESLMDCEILIECV